MVSWDTSQLRSPLLGLSPKRLSLAQHWPCWLDNMPETMGFEPHTQYAYVTSCGHSYTDLVGRWGERERRELDGVLCVRIEY